MGMPALTFVVPDAVAPVFFSVSSSFFFLAVMRKCTIGDVRQGHAPSLFFFFFFFSQLSDRVLQGHNNAPSWRPVDQKADRKPATKVKSSL